MHLHTIATVFCRVSLAPPNVWPEQTQRSLYRASIRGEERWNEPTPRETKVNDSRRLALEAGQAKARTILYCREAVSGARVACPVRTSGAARLRRRHVYDMNTAVAERNTLNNSR